MNGNPLSPKPYYYHPLPRQYVWADNFISAFGLLQPKASNVILTNDFPVDAPNVLAWVDELATFHSYPILWYDATIQVAGYSSMGFQWSFERGAPLPLAPTPTNGSVYLQAITNSEGNLLMTNWNYGTNLLAARFQDYLGQLVYSTSNEFPEIVSAVGLVGGQIIKTSQSFNAFVLSIGTTRTNTSQTSVQSQVQPLSLTPNDTSSSTNVPAYAWMPLDIPPNAISMSFDYIIQGDWQSDSLAVALNGTNVLLIAGSAIETNVTFSSGPIDVSAYAGQTNEFFIGIVGGTSTNAHLTFENLAFSVLTSPTLQAETSGGNVMLSWPISAQTYNLQTTTNLTDPNSWVTLTNAPAIVNLQNTVTNPLSDRMRFYRLKQ